jgi:hypothetical protein
LLEAKGCIRITVGLKAHSPPVSPEAARFSETVIAVEMAVLDNYRRMSAISDWETSFSGWATI